jgi:hypothetical protein
MHFARQHVPAVFAETRFTTGNTSRAVTTRYTRTAIRSTRAGFSGSIHSAMFPCRADTAHILGATIISRSAQIARSQ